MSLVLIETLHGHEDVVWGVSWRPNYPSQLASCGASRILLWDYTLAENKIKAVLFNKSPSVKNYHKKTIEIPYPVNETVHSKTARNVSWSRDGKCLGVASFDASVSLWVEKELNKWEVFSIIQGQENEIKQLSWSGDNKHIATCSRNKSIWLHSLYEDRFICTAILTGHLQDVKYVLWHPTEKIIFSCSYDSTIRIWAPLQKIHSDDEEEWNCIDILSQHKSTVWQISLSQCGREFASCSEDKTVRIWTAVPRDSEIPLAHPWSFVLSPSLSISSKWSNKLPLTKHNWVCSAIISGYYERPIYSVAWHPNADIIATACGNNSIHIFQRVEKPKVHLNSAPEESSWNLICFSTDTHSSDINVVTWNPKQCDDGSWLLATGDDDGDIHIFKFNDKLLQKLS